MPYSPDSIAPGLPILYSFRRCPYAMRARLALRYAGIRCELREITLRAKPVEMLVASPKGTVPVLILDPGGPAAEVIDESIDIMLWALAQHDPQGWLDAEPAIAGQLIDANDDGFKIWVDRYKYPDRYPDIEPDLPRDECARFLRHMDERLQQHGCLTGTAMTLVDYAILPFVRQCVLVDKGWFRALQLQAANRWLDGFLESDLFAAVMEKYPVWTPAERGAAF